MFWQKSFALVLDSTSKACRCETNTKTHFSNTFIYRESLHLQACVSDLVCVVGEVDFMEDLGRFMLDSLHFHQMRRVLPGSISVNDDKKQQNWLEKKYVNTKYDDCFRLKVWGVTVALCAPSACSLQTAGGASWTGGSAECAATARYWEETTQCTTTAAPSLSPHCTCSNTTLTFSFCTEKLNLPAATDWMMTVHWMQQVMWTFRVLTSSTQFILHKSTFASFHGQSSISGVFIGVGFDYRFSD